MESSRLGAHKLVEDARTQHTSLFPDIGIQGQCSRSFQSADRTLQRITHKEQTSIDIRNHSIAFKYNTVQRRIRPARLRQGSAKLISKPCLRRESRFKKRKKSSSPGARKSVATVTAPSTRCMQVKSTKAPYTCPHACCAVLSVGSYARKLNRRHDLSRKLQDSHRLIVTREKRR